MISAVETPLEIYTRQFALETYANVKLMESDTYALQKLPATGDLIDVGTGRGFFLKRLLAERPRFKVRTVDLAKFHDLDVPFTAADLTSPEDLSLLSGMRSQFLTCIGVVEHLTEAQAEPAVAALSKIPRELAVITTANHSDVGADGVELYLIQRPAEWWVELLSKYFAVDDVWHFAKLRGICFTLTPRTWSSR